MIMKKVEVKELSENFFEAIGKEWMLVTAGNKEAFNTCLLYTSDAADEL
mgnify:CR=1 FL=1